MAALEGIEGPCLPLLRPTTFDCVQLSATASNSVQLRATARVRASACACACTCVSGLRRVRSPPPLPLSVARLLYGRMSGVAVLGAEARRKAAVYITQVRLALARYVYVDR